MLSISAFSISVFVGMYFVFWQNIISPHQAPFLRSLAEFGHEVVVIAADDMTSDRTMLGWKVPDLGKARVVINPNLVEVRQLVNGSPRDSVHIMAGARWYPLGNQALQQCRKSGRRVGVLSEAPDPRGLGGCARWAKYTLERFSIGSHYDFVLAMGELGVKWFRSCGYPVHRVFPFAYVPEGFPIVQAHSPNSSVSLLFAGRFLHLKGLDLLLRAFAEIPQDRTQLRLLGDGPEKQNLQNQTTSLGIFARIIWLPKTDSLGVLGEMGRADVTLLPSRKDGWGAVVNESLSVGTPVICSAACGAAELIHEPWLGTVFKSGSIPDLTRALQHWIDIGPRKEIERDRIRNWAKCISGDAVASFFLAIMKHIYASADRPEAPWRISK